MRRESHRLGEARSVCLLALLRSIKEARGRHLVDEHGQGPPFCLQLRPSLLKGRFTGRLKYTRSFVRGERRIVEAPREKAHLRPLEQSEQLGTEFVSGHGTSQPR